ncbi:hypothetical protein F542_8250 [Bibersteinia trehalosi USDA-ARS-USMARC-188]|uniref:DUF262 domain-containing protein n=2 Tax=Bibersteinia trehalosi TaxID=47735 RepID=A0A4V7I946_BIBTR|nr:DUF262 domain-containing protein [Bibersteinia trehalosi]AGH38656.1 hypothetical protein WQG_13790 [Bibersteinia trehalosi USDA-ARS-USMARC-192]AHG81543.1 hypothetical protein F542_8250 [Bibersteinia trehalosi USDA-ARS-USMARC-188]AHG83818.1 hypothetical protein F543_9540 [Bibersteinia trehalosi USDA-ARS-USMARC-189]
MINTQVRTLCVKDLCNNDKYIVPIYQRNYAWGKDEIELLIQDILEALNKNESKNYYIGSLVVSKRKDGYEVIDGQQRLTTLKLLLSYYNKKENVHLDFEHRNESNDSFKNLHSKQSQKNAIEQGFQIIKNYNELAENDKKQKFFDFLLERVVILRTEVPEDTDLNHYFEIMNNRGEQLEKHEVLKARLMDKLQENERALFSLIWDACSDMNVYAIKRFPYSNDDSKSIRTNENFFGEFCHLIPSDFEKMLSNFNVDSDTSASGSILDLLSSYKIENKKEVSNQNYDEIRDGSFNSIIDFPNFLMIVLRIFTSITETKKDIPLNDKFLLGAFNSYLAEEKIKEFIVCLLKCRLIFDRYIIKSRDEEDSWSLNGLKKYRNGKYFYFKEVNTFGTAFENKERELKVVDEGVNYDTTDSHTKIVQLLSMFHTAFRQKIYKEWLYDVLCSLYKNDSLKDEYGLSPSSYIIILEELAYNYYMDDDRQKLFNQKGQCIPSYIFNYLDYLLWRDWNDKVGKDNKFVQKDSFVFSLSRNSIEHYLPQSRRDSLLDDVEDSGNKRDDILNSFGNLCLISHYQNSSLNDEIPSEKVKRYESGSLRCISPKQALMLTYDKWDSININKHNDEMMKIFDEERDRLSELKNN